MLALAATEFLEPRSVQAWDAWFRWRSAGVLRDVTIDDTWQRIAGALAGGDAARSTALVEAFSRWRLLPDERLLARAGTGLRLQMETAPRAVLVVPGFLAGSPAARYLDFDALQRTAELAVWALEGARGALPAVRLGLVGMADALQQLGLDYDSEAARQVAARVAATLARGSLQASIRIAAATGRASAPTREQLRRWQARHPDDEWHADALRFGVAHEQLTCVERGARLALLANDVADALDPLLPGARAGAGRPGAAARRRPEPPSAPAPSAGVEAQLRMRAAVQPWIDAPIDHHLHVAETPASHERDALAALAQALGQTEPCYRRYHALQVA